MAEIMEKTEFVEEIKTSLGDLGELEVMEVNKGGYTYTGIAVRVVGKPTPVFNMNRLYTKYKNGTPIEDCKNMAREVLTSAEYNMPFSVQDLTNWDFAKDKLYIKLVGSVPAGAISRKLLDLYLVPYIAIDNESTCAVVEGLKEAWGMDEETIFEQAKTNQEVIRPLSIISLPERLRISGSALPVYVVGVDNAFCGASAILYEGAVDAIKEKIGEFYILPSSVHEVLVISKEYVGDSVSKLKSMVSLCNIEEVSAEEILSNSIYSYDFEKREFIQVM